MTTCPPSFLKNGWVKTELSRQTFEQRDSPLSKIMAVGMVGGAGVGGGGVGLAQCANGLKKVRLSDAAQP